MDRSQVPQDSRQAWQDRIQGAVERAEDDLRKVVAYINDEVVPEVRRNSSDALRTAAGELRKLAEQLEAANHRTPPR